MGVEVSPADRRIHGIVVRGRPFRAVRHFPWEVARVEKDWATLAVYGESPVAPVADSSAEGGREAALAEP